MHEGLQQARAPVYDVPFAIKILLTGSYKCLPEEWTFLEWCMGVFFTIAAVIYIIEIRYTR